MIDLKSALAVLLLFGALVYADTDEFSHRCAAGDKEYCVK